MKNKGPMDLGTVDYSEGRSRSRLGVLLNKEQPRSDRLPGRSSKDLVMSGKEID